MSFTPDPRLVELTKWRGRQVIKAFKPIKTPRRLSPWRKSLQKERELICGFIRRAPADSGTLKEG
jgi:hypothetical protein